jgi:hypothetical protein
LERRDRCRRIGERADPAIAAVLNPEFVAKLRNVVGIYVNPPACSALSRKACGFAGFDDGQRRMGKSGPWGTERRLVERDSLGDEPFISRHVGNVVGEQLDQEARSWLEMSRKAGQQARQGVDQVRSVD